MNRLPMLRLLLAGGAALTLAASGCAPKPPVGPTPPTGPGAGPQAPGAPAAGPKKPLPPRVPGKRRGAGSDQPGPAPGPQSTISNPAAAGPEGRDGKLLLAMYVIGSDLEDDVLESKGTPDQQDLAGELPKNGAATSDFNEIVEAVKGLSEAERANIDVLIAFGGARQDHWKGMKIVDLEGLLKDGEDGYYGNAEASTYISDAPGADMGDPKNFRAFLDQVQARRGGAAKVFLDIWNHGGSFAGMGPDTVTQGQLTNDETQDVFEQANFKADMIGYDACLMGSVEVMRIVQGHADILVASEETEPGHGWDYTLWLPQAAKRPDASPAEIGKLIVDSFIDSPKHRSTDGRTLGVYNVAKGGELLRAVHAMGSALQTQAAESIDPILDANRAAQRYGSSGKDDDEFARDLKGFCLALKTEDADLASAADAVVKGIEDCVFYAREDGTKPGSFGLSVYSFTNTGWFEDKTVNERTAASEAWFGFLQAVNAKADSDSQKPTLSQEQTATEDGEAGTTTVVSDDTGVDDVEAVHAYKPDPNKDEYVVVSSEQEEEVAENTYFQPKWDGRSLHLVGSDGTKVVVPITKEGEHGGYEVWSAVGQLNGDDVTFRLFLDADHNVVNTNATPFNEDAEGNPIISRDQVELQPDDQVAFYRQIIDNTSDQERFELGDVVVYGGSGWSWEEVDGNAVYYTVAEDMNGNQENSPIHEDE